MIRISAKTHGYIDYITGAALIALPWITGMKWSESRGIVLIIAGTLIITNSLFTNYKIGIKPVIAMPFHLVFDGFIGIFLAMSPWMFKFSDSTIVPHVSLAALLVLIALITRTGPRPKV